LQAALPGAPRLPRESTILRTLRQIDPTTLEQHVARFVTGLPSATDHTGCIITPQGEILQGHALDGKAVRTASAHGTRTHLVSLVQHESAVTVAQTKVADKRAEGSACQQLLTGRDLSGMVITLDAGLTQRKLAEQIRAQHGHYFMVVKKNHPQMYAEIGLFFDLPGIVADAECYDRHRSVSKGHGRLETRTVECLSGSCVDWHWPDTVQVVRRTCERLECKSGKRTVTVSYALTSLSADEARAPDLEQLWRGHWTIENGKHYVRDVTLGEDRQPMYRGHAPEVLATLRSALIDVWRAWGWTNIADATRVCAASVQAALDCISTRPTLTLT
jgi:predicted transposase YbfD/YdcC